MPSTIAKSKSTIAGAFNATTTTTTTNDDNEV